MVRRSGKLIGRNSTLYGDVGQDAIDLSYSSFTSTEAGAMGPSSIAFGQNVWVGPDGWRNSVVGGADSFITTGNDSSIIGSNDSSITATTAVHVSNSIVGGLASTMANVISSAIYGGDSAQMDSSSQSFIGAGKNATIYQGIASSIVGGISSTTWGDYQAILGGEGAEYGFCACAYSC